MGKESKVLVYHYRRGDSPAVPHGLAVITERELADVLESNPTLQATRKTLPRGATSVDIHQRDLRTATQVAADEGQGYPNGEANVAGVRLPFGVWLGSAFAGRHSEVVVLSKRV